MNIVENFLPQKLADSIENTMAASKLDAFFPWFYNPQTVLAEYAMYKGENAIDTFQFVHMMYNSADNSASSYHSEIAIPIVWFIENHGISVNNLYRVKANLMTRQPYDSQNFNTPHTDLTTNGMVGLYYVNDSDGDTVFFEERYKKDYVYDKLTIANKVTPKKNTMVFFDATQFHASTPPVENDYRCVINFVFG